MQQRDYLLREIEKIGDMLRYFIRKLVDQKEQTEEQQITEQLNDEFFETFEVDMDTFLRMSFREMIKLIENKKGFTPGNIELLGDLLIHLADRDIEFQMNYLEKAKELFEYINTKSDTFSMTLSQKITHLELKIGKQ